MGILGNKLITSKKKTAPKDPYAESVVLLLEANESSLVTNTTTTTNFIVPAIGATVNVNVNSSAWAAVNKAIRIGGGGGNYNITNVSGSTLTIRNCGGNNNAATGTTINSNATVALSIIDTSPSPKLINAFGNVQINSNGILFDGNGDYLQIPAYIDSFTGDFTAEAQMYVAASNWNGVLHSLNDNTEFTLGALNTPGLFRTTFRNTNIESTSVVPVNTDFHLAFSRVGTGVNNCKVFLNGNILHQFTNNSILDIFNNLLIGSYDTLQYFMNGYIKKTRWTKIGRYNTPFNPETDTYL